MQPDQLPPPRTVEPCIEANLQPNEGLSTQGPMSSRLQGKTKAMLETRFTASSHPPPSIYNSVSLGSGRYSGGRTEYHGFLQQALTSKPPEGENCNGIIIVHHIKGLHVCIVSEAVPRNRQLQGSSIQCGPSIDEVLV